MASVTRPRYRDASFSRRAEREASNAGDRPRCARMILRGDTLNGECQVSDVPQPQIRRVQSIRLLDVP